MIESKLKQIFDEVEHSSDKWLPYFEVYERHLRKFVDKPIHLVEVGVQKGGSLEMWGKYFEKAKITGIDVDPVCGSLKYDNPNITVTIGDQGSPEFWDSFLATSSIDVFIDDGGHTMEQQIVTFEKVFPKMNMGGIFICEDCHTSYMRNFGGGFDSKHSFINYAKGYIDVVHQLWIDELDTSLEHKKKIGKELTGVHFYDSMVVFEKTTKREMKRVFPKKHS